MQNRPNECSICGINYREQAVKSLDRRSRFLFREKRKAVFGKINDKEIYVTIGKASKHFKNFTRFNEQYVVFWKERIRRPHLRFESKDKGIDIGETLYNPVTIKVFNINEPNIEQAIKKSDQIIESCFFDLSYLKKIPLGIVEELPRYSKTQKREIFEYDKRVEGYNFSLPSVLYNSNTLKFYQLGMSTDIPILKFLTFYQVLEYYFIKVSDELLYQAISAKLNDPKFKTVSTSDLDRIITIVEDHKRNIKGPEMLKNVIKNFVNEPDLRNFIDRYETYLDDNLYTKPRTVFGEELKPDERHIFGNVAKCITTVRNALVHSSDRYERRETHIPFSESTEIVKKEIPLVKFLAEKVIISSATKNSIQE